MKIGKYIKNGIKYVLYDYKPKNVYVKPELKTPNDVFKDKVVLITGGSEGIGLEIARRFGEEGAHVIITGRNEKKLKEAVKSLRNARYYVNDISKIDSHYNLLNDIFDSQGTVDILINNAGISKHEKDFFDVSVEGFDEQFDINVKGGYFLTQSLIKRKKRNLNVIFITSERGSQCDYLPYGLTKVVINSLVEGLSCRFYKDNIRVNGVAPGVTATKMTGINKDGNLASDSFVSGRKFIVEEVAETVLFLASEYANCISGEIIHCNGGNHLNRWF